MEYKVNFGDPKTGKTVKKVISDKAAEFFLKKRIGDKVKGDDFGFEGYEFEITGGSDHCGFPMRKDVRGAGRKKVLIVRGTGIRNNKKTRDGRKVRKTVAGSVIYAKTAQINLKILKMGAKPLAEPEAKEGEATETKVSEPPKTKSLGANDESLSKPAKQATPVEAKKEAKPEAPKEEKKKEVKPADNKKDKEPKKEEKPKEEPKKEEKPKEEEKK